MKVHFNVKESKIEYKQLIEPLLRASPEQGKNPCFNGLELLIIDFLYRIVNE